VIIFKLIIIWIWFIGTILSTIAVLGIGLRIIWFPFNVYEDWEELKDMFNIGALFWVIVFIVGWGIALKIDGAI
jgi:hypothetical protein